MSLKQIVVNLWFCKCERCGHQWQAKKLPKRCAGCKKFFWNVPAGKLPRGRPASRSTKSTGKRGTR